MSNKESGRFQNNQNQEQNNQNQEGNANSTTNQNQSDSSNQSASDTGRTSGYGGNLNSQLDLMQLKGKHRYSICIGLFLASLFLLSCSKEKDAIHQTNNLEPYSLITVDPTNTNNPEDSCGVRVQQWLSLLNPDFTVIDDNLDTTIAHVFSIINNYQNTIGKSNLPTTVADISDFALSINNNDLYAAADKAYSKGAINLTVKNIVINFLNQTEPYCQGSATADASTYNGLSISFENNLANNASLGASDKSTALKIISAMKYANAYAYNNIDYNQDPGFIVIVVIILVVIFLTAVATPAY